MKYKKIMLILITAIFLVSIASVCAGDIENGTIQVSNDVMNDVVALEEDSGDGDTEVIVSEHYGADDNGTAVSSQLDSENGDADVITSVEENGQDLLAAGSKYSFSELQTLIDNAGEGGEISLNHDYSLAAGGFTIKITKGLTINGNKHTIDGASLNRIFDVCYLSGAPLVLKNIVFKNGGSQPHKDVYETERGGAICFTLPGGDVALDEGICLTLIDCTFSGNGVSKAGGAIYSEVDMKITGSVFSNNIVGDIGNGGAIWCNGKVNASNSNFRSNMVGHGFVTRDALSDYDTWMKTFTYYMYSGTQSDGLIPPTGGAIFCNKNSEFNHCDFSSNQVGEENEMGTGGGAIHCMDNIIVRNSNFISNVAFDQEGGAILSNGHAFIYDSTFSNNVANSGGAVSCFLSADIYRSEFINNGHEKGTSWIEAMSLSYILCEVPVVGEVLNFLDIFGVDTQFLSVNSISAGGAVLSAGDIYAKDCTFSKNEASEYGGALYARDVEVRDCTFASNSVARADNVIMEALQWQGATRSGGAIHAQVDLTIKNSEFTGNYAAIQGGAASCERRCEVSSSNFAHNSANSKGGAIFAKSISKVTNSIFDNNEATKYGGDGGAIYIAEYSNAQITSCEFYSNEAWNSGGAIFLDNRASNLKVSKSKFDRNTANVNGGAISTNAIISISSSEFYSNEAGEDSLKMAFGGAVYSEKDVTVSNSKFSKNSVFNRGGAIYTEANVKVDNSEFFANSARYGGAIFASEINDRIYMTSFTANFAKGDGGAIYIVEDCYPKINACIFEDNLATSRLSIGDTDIIKPRGGAIYAPKSHIKVTGSTFSANSADYGGAIYTATVTDISNSKFTYNQVKTNDGGAVYVNKECTFTISSSTFEGNTAKNKGAAVYNPHGSIKLQSSTFTQNTADDGGAIYTNKIEYPSNVVFTGNVARNGDGGAIYISGQCSPEFTRCTFQANRAENGDGGGVYFKPTLKNSRVKITGCSFINNYAKKSGGGLYVEEVSSIQNSVFNNNEAKNGGGGAVYIGHAITQDILSSKFSDNKAGKYGGAICADSSSLHKMQYCEFYQNTAQRGGAVYIGKITDGIFNSIFIKNKALKEGEDDCDGGAVYTSVNQKCDFTIKECRFEGNYANKRGGAVYTDTHGLGNGGKLYVLYCTFVDNKANKTGYSGGSEGHDIFHKGEYKELYGLWMGSNNPDLSKHFVKEDWIGKDTVCYPKDRLELVMGISNNHPVAGNPYEVYLGIFIPNGGATSDYWSILHGTASFWGSEGFISSIANNGETKDSMSAVVTFNSGQGTIYGKLNHQELHLNLQTTAKYPCSVNITYCDDVQYPDALRVGYEIEHMENAIYEIRDSQGEIVKTGNLTDPNAVDIEGIIPGSYSITIINPESYSYLSGSANATFRISKGNIEELRIVAQDQTSTEAIKGLVYSSDDGEYKLTVAGTTTVVTVRNHIGYFKLGALLNGNYEAVISFEDHELYVPFSNITAFTVSDEVDLFEIDINPGEVEYGQNFVISHRLPEGATGTIEYYLINGTYIGQANAGENITLQQFTVGPKFIVANYSGDANLASQSDIAYLLVNSAVASCDARLKYKDYYGDWYDYNAWLSNYYGGYVHVILRDSLQYGMMRIYHKIADGATGTVTYYKDGTQVAKGSVGLEYTIPTNIPAGFYNFTVEYSGDEHFEPASDTLCIVVKEPTDTFQIYIHGGTSYTTSEGSRKIICGDDEVEIRSMIDYSTTVNAILYIDGVEFCQFVPGESTNVPYLDPGRHLVNAYFPGDSQNPKGYSAFFLDVQTNHTDVELGFDTSLIDYGETLVITNAVPENATGTIDYYIVEEYSSDESSLNESSQDEIFLGRVNVGENFTLPILGGGDKIIIAKYSGDWFFMDSTVSINLTVNRIEPTFEVEASASEFDYVESVYISHVLTDIATGTIEYYLGDGTYLGEAPVGENFTLPRINAGNQEIVAWYMGDRNFTLATYSIAVTVKPTSRFEFSVSGNETCYGEIATICPALPDDATGTIAYYLSNGTYLGEAPANENFTLPKLAAGIYEIVARYSGDLNYLAASCNASTIVNKATIFDADITDSEVNYGETAIITHALPDDANGTIAYYLSNGTYLGEAPVGVYFALPKFDAGTYEIVANYSGDANFNSASDSVELTVNKVPSLVGLSIEFEVGSVGSAYISFGDAVGVEAHVLGQPNAVVDVSGNKISVSGLDEGTYVLSITTIPDANHDAVTGYADIIVNKKSDAESSSTPTNTNAPAKKSKPKLTAKKKSFKRSVKVKKYTITLKTNLNKALKNAKVTLKIKGKTYKATTNAKGKAVFKIKKLTKKGTFKATVKYAGNAYYTAVTKTVKIKLK